MNIEEVRCCCLEKRGATEDSAFGPDLILFRLCGKIFACIDLTRPHLVVLKMTEEQAIEMRERYNGINGAWHWNKKYWSEVDLTADVDDALVRKMLDDSYNNVREHLPKKTLYHFPDLPEGWAHEHFPVLDSAMNALHWPEIKQNTAPYLLVTTDYQTAGRGQGKNTWESEDTKNLLFAIRFYPTQVKAVDQYLLLECISVAVVKCLEKFLKRQLSIKWPNDIYVDDKKICGILIEHTICGAYLAETRCGIGINVNQSEFKSDAPNPVSLRQLLGKEVDRAAVLRNFLIYFMESYHFLLGEKISRVRLDYYRRLYRAEGFYPYRDQHGEFEAELECILSDGRLVLKDRDGRERTYAHKEVEYIIQQQSK